MSEDGKPTLEDAGEESRETVALDEAGSAPPGGNLQTAPTERPGDPALPARRAPLPIVDASRYALAGELSRGGMGRVLAATDRRLDRPVAVKQLVAGGRVRFEREARLTARLQHPSIVRVYDAWREPGGDPAYAMEIVRGRSFDKVIAEANTLPARLGLLPHVLAVAEAIAYAHSQRIIHRDLKPQNVLVGAFGETVVIDWGLAKELSSSDDQEEVSLSPAADGLTAVGAVVGTPAYMPPEQAAGEPVDERADVYALGAMLHYLLAGAPPSRTPGPLLRGVPQELAAIARKAMERDPAARYPTARELAQDLRRFQTGQLVAAHRYTLGALVRRWIARHRLAASVALAVLVSAGFSIGLSMSRIIQSRRAAESAARALYQEQGRRLLLAGDPMRALVYLAKAYQEGSRGADLSFLLARAEGALAPERRVLRGHGGRVGIAAFSPDGKLILTAGEDGIARLWDVASDGAPRALAGHTDAIFAATFSPDGARIATAGWDRTARIWDTASGRPTATLRHPGRVVTAVFSPDGTRLVTGSEGDFTARVWDVASGTPVRALEGHRAPVWTAAFSPDGRRLVTGSADRTARVWDLASGRAELTLTGHQDQIWSASFDPAGARIVTAGWDRAARLWDAHSGQLLATFEHDPVPGAQVSVFGTSAAFSPDGSRVATACADNAARVWDTASGRLVRVLRGHAGYILSLAYSRDGSRIATASSDGTARIWDASSGELSGALHGHLDAIHRIAFSPDGTRAVTASADHTGRLWDVTRPPERLRVRADDGARFQYATTSDDGRWLVAADQWQRVHLWRTSDRRPRAVVGTQAETRSGFASFDPAATAIATIAGRTVEIREVEDPRRVRRVITGHDGAVTSARFSPDGHRLVTASEDGSARVWDADSGRPLARMSGHAGTVWFAIFSSDGRRVATAGQDHTARLWDASTGAELRVLSGHSLDVVTAELSPDGRRVVTASLDRTARIWDASTGRTLALLEGHTAEVTFASFHPSLPLVVTASVDGAARVWSADGALLDVIGRHASGINSALFTRDGSAVVTAGDDGSVRLWPVAEELRAPGEVARFARCRAPFRLVRGRLVDADHECAPPP